MSEHQNASNVVPRNPPGNPGWKKGVSGNPAGRKPHAYDLSAQCRELAPKAIKTLIECLDDPRWKLPAAVVILERGFGKVKQEIDAQGGNVTVLHLVAARALAHATPEQIEQSVTDVIDEAEADDAPLGADPPPDISAPAVE